VDPILDAAEKQSNLCAPAIGAGNPGAPPSGMPSEEGLLMRGRRNWSRL
jgi:hypothetical protein